MLLEEARCFDRALVAPVNECNSPALDLRERRFRHYLRGGGHERRHLRPRLRSLRGPTGALTDIGEAHIAAALGGDLAEQGRFLRAADRDRRARRQQRANTLDLGAAELAARDDVGSTASPLERTHVERHRLFTRTYKKGAPVRHRLARQARGATISCPAIGRKAVTDMQREGPRRI